MTTIDDGWAGSEGLMHDTPPHPTLEYPIVVTLHAATKEL